jgi:holo-[acyl-carrier protein] synthase
MCRDQDLDFPMYGIGNDIVYIPRVVKLVQSYGDRFARKFLHPKEFESYKARSSAKNAITFLAGRWGVKEATYKALGTRNVAFTDLWVKEGPRGKFQIEFRIRSNFIFTKLPALISTYT